MFKVSLDSTFQAMELAIGSIMNEIFSSYSNTYYFNYLFGNKELLSRQVESDRLKQLWSIQGSPVGV